MKARWHAVPYAVASWSLPIPHASLLPGGDVAISDRLQDKTLFFRVGEGSMQVRLVQYKPPLLAVHRRHSLPSPLLPWRGAPGQNCYSIRPDAKTQIFPAPDASTTRDVAAVSLIPPFKKFHCICWLTANGIGPR